ncbi:bifunctional riboflavin kinase and FAD synthetase [Cupriavidus taiwanensis]|uniref:Bifunctional riboflavin kinase/FMN adenylyltransferase n=1 Tax=Cupriavidus taiwanensis TaxID=164546 RepID=A0A7Z7J9K4_9BURK|nr:bifunctional: flavokinase; FAD synthetase [Cupriavidus taiwanensis]SOZ03102.1 bifunctional: flavokinase; FAD synthetase [Cupriavidus taiwanensis]SOZ06376.1 bifunctional: flavokinase; FAD synthetase [Cupriavidus taiwanensis]SPC18908.1 bifunctional: flavokinase; FAD synthetase [Cupriavidus taiwanensis]SPD41363.1 bifunctional riboflavin kinase and FAD synthetase [Cupriavidus taiwanensis]
MPPFAVSRHGGRAGCGTKAAAPGPAGGSGSGKPTHSPYNARFTRIDSRRPVKVFRGLPNAESRAPCALTIGNFDGVHRGHQSLLARARAAADARGLPLCVMTFEPHPREFFTPDKAPTRIALLRDKLESLRRNGVDRVVVEHFNAHFAGQSPQEFVENVLWHGLHTRWLLVGDDFRFGAKRAGDFAYLQEAGRRYGFDVEQMGSVSEGGIRISSSAVRQALADGDLEHARRLLGHGYAISGHVIHGRKLGRDLGFPTLNLRISHKRPAVSGIFVVQVHGIADHPLPGVASIGVRPTIEDAGRVLLEVHLFDFNESLYGKLVRVEFMKKLRDEARFDSLDELTAAIAKDSADARAFFGLTAPGAAAAEAEGSGRRDFATSATDRIR